MGVNPNILVIFDDIVPIMHILKEKLILFFMEGRHYNITTVVSAQKFRSIDPGIRNNSVISLFTDQKNFCCYLEDNKSRYTKDDRGRLHMFAQDVFAEDHKIMVVDEQDKVETKKIAGNTFSTEVLEPAKADIYRSLSVPMKRVLRLEKESKKNVDIDTELKNIK